MRGCLGSRLAQAADHLSGPQDSKPSGRPYADPLRFKVRRIFMASPLSRALDCGLSRHDRSESLTVLPARGHQ